MRYLLLITAALMGASACAPLEFDPPSSPAHLDEKDGFLHARRLRAPFNCATATDPQSRNGVPCATARPPDAQLSCDAIGCHGGFDFTSDPLTTPRHLRGSQGPSCYTCHGDKWNEEEDEPDEPDN